jgi:hypothetical protein
MKRPHGIPRSRSEDNIKINVNNNFQQMHFSYIYYIFQSAEEDIWAQEG